MAGIFSFTCSCCGKIHEGSPSYGFRAPDHFLEQSKEVREAGHLDEDLCRYTDEEGEHFFVRACIEVPIHGVSEPFLWGVWVSLSQKNFDRYVATYDQPDPSDSYFGWLCNQLPYYERTHSLKTSVHPRAGGIRPLVIPERTDHRLSVDFHEGISVARAQEIAEAAMHRLQQCVGDGVVAADGDQPIDRVRAVGGSEQLGCPGLDCCE